jgi:hypothetical protein
MRFVRLALLLVALIYVVLPSRAQVQTNPHNNTAKDICPAPGAVLPDCSFTATNGNCTITINRMQPVTPPTIYVRRGCLVKVEAKDTYPLEDLTLDWKASATVLPPDTFQTAFSSLTATLGKVTVIAAVVKTPTVDRNFMATIQNDAKCEDRPLHCTDSVSISRAQKRVELLIASIDPLSLAASAIDDIKAAIQPPPGGKDADKQPWHDTKNWKTNTVAKLDYAVSQYKDEAKLKQITDETQNLDVDLAALKAKAQTQPEKSVVVLLEDNQTALKAELTDLTASPSPYLKAYLPKLRALATGITDLTLAPQGIPGNSLIEDTKIDNKNYQTQTWVLNYTNKLQPLAKRVAAETLKSEDASHLSSVADAPAKQPIVTITVQFQSPSHVEVSTGLMVPLTPYHSYVKASVATNGMISDNVVQETRTYAVVPMAFINILAREWIARKQRSAFFVTGGVGYNPSTTAVEFGTGLTYSYRSIAFSGLVDIGRDTKLGGGFTVGQSLGPTNAAANPITSTYWAVKPAAAVSVRIPLGGSGSK